MSLAAPQSPAPSGHALTLGVVAACYNGKLVDALLARVLAGLKAAGVKAKKLTVLRVPGSNEQVTPFTATWPPKRMVRLWVASIKFQVKTAPCAWISSAYSYENKSTPGVPLRGSDQRLLRIGTCISSGLISRTSSGTPQAKAGSTLILKWYMLCIA